MQRMVLRVATLAAVLLAQPLSVSQAADGCGGYRPLDWSWSDTYGPNSYKLFEGTTRLQALADWQAPGWAEVQAGFGTAPRARPFVFRSNGTETFEHDYAEDDVVVVTAKRTASETRGPASITRTFDGEGYAGIEGEVWPGRHRGRRVAWKLFRNDELLSQGRVLRTATKEAPVDLATGSGGPQALEAVEIRDGDQIRLELHTRSTRGEFVGINLVTYCMPSGTSVTMTPSTSTTSTTFPDTEAELEDTSSEVAGMSSIADGAGQSLLDSPSPVEQPRPRPPVDD
jgi:hypothetical protein